MDIDTDNSTDTTQTYTNDEYRKALVAYVWALDAAIDSRITADQRQSLDMLISNLILIVTSRPSEIWTRDLRTIRQMRDGIVQERSAIIVMLQDIQETVEGLDEYDAWLGGADLGNGTRIGE